MQRDYILRMIEQSATVLRALLNRVLRREADPAEVTQALRHAAALGSLDIDLLRLSDADTVLLMVAPGGEPEPGRTWLAAEMLYLDGLAAKLDDRASNATTSFAKARLLFGLVSATGVLPSDFPEATQRIREIDGYLADLQQPPGDFAG
jgi:hypothetical protein